MLIIFLLLGPLDYKKKTYKKRSSDNDSEEVRICADRASYNGKIPKRFIGTFKNGTLHGPGMAVLQDNTTLIANFDMGDPKGLIRFFSSEGKLLDIYYEDRRKRGHIWMNKSKNKKYLIYTDVSFVNTRKMENSEPDSVVIPMGKSKF